MSTTTHFNLPKPDETADVDEEFIRLQGTLDLLDAILKSLQDLVNGKAATSHTHSIAQITDLATQLAAKMPASQTFKLDDLTDVSGADDAANTYLLVKSALGWVPSSPVAALGAHGHTIAQITGLVDALAAKADATATVSALTLKADQTTTYTKDEVDTAVASAVAAAKVPIGFSLLWNSTTIPTGFLKENGAAISRTTYAALFAIIGTTYGVGDGSTTFNLPDSRGEFFRGLDDGRGLDSGRALWVAQDASRVLINPNGGGSPISVTSLAASRVAMGLEAVTTAAAVPVDYVNRVATGTSGATGEAFVRPRNVAKLVLIRAY